MQKKEKRITLFIGNLGSGKTELAINYALGIQKRGYHATIVDLDIINPYFRTRLVREQLLQRGLKVISPEGALAGADVPALSPKIKGVFENQELYSIFDVGGDDVGATVLGRFADLFFSTSYELFFVVNACRPFTQTAHKVINMLHEIEKAAGLKVTSLVNNTNLGPNLTTVSTIIEGQKMLEEVSLHLGLPIAFIGTTANLIPTLRNHLSNQVPLMPLELFMQPPW